MFETSLGLFRSAAFHAEYDAVSSTAHSNGLSALRENSVFRPTKTLPTIWLLCYVISVISIFRPDLLVLKQRADSWTRPSLVMTHNFLVRQQTVEYGDLGNCAFKIERTITTSTNDEAIQIGVQC